MTQVVRPILPYRGPIPGGLQDGKIIEIKGVILLGADSCSINLQTGLDLESDRALHLSVSVPKRKVVLNHFEMKKWGKKEKGGSFPFLPGQEFTMKIQVEKTAYRIAVNDQHCWMFVHRIPTSRVSSMFIEGHVQIEKIDYIDTKPSGIFPAGRTSSGYDQYPQPAVCSVPPYPARMSQGECVMPSVPTAPAVPSYPIPGQGIYPTEQICPQPAYIAPVTSNLPPVYNPTVPYAYPIYGGLKMGMIMYITGRPTTNNRFTVNLQSGTNPYPPPDIAFHFGVRLDSHTVARNCRTNNVWEREENFAAHFPFRQGVMFEMIIRVDPDRFMVALDNQHYVEFRHRLHPLERFDTLYIENDVAIESIRFA